MCVMSMVYDYYDRAIPDVQIGPNWIGTTTWTGTTTQAPLEIAKWVQDFNTAAAAAKVVDEKTGQTDCVDPEKQKLEARIAELEKLIANPPEFVVLTGGNVEPGTYRVVDGKLYRAV